MESPVSPLPLQLGASKQFLFCYADFSIPSFDPLLRIRTEVVACPLKVVSFVEESPLTGVIELYTHMGGIKLDAKIYDNFEGFPLNSA